MAEAATDDDFDRLLAAHLDDGLDAADAARLQERLRQDADARRLLLAAACQAAALPRLGLEAALPRPVPVQRPRHRWWLPSAAAAALLVGVLAWWFSSTTVAVRVSGGVVERAGRSGPGDATVRPGDRLVSAAGPAVLSWPDEDTRLDLAGGSSLRVEELGTRKVMRLEHGGLEAVVAPQPAAGGLIIVTPHGRVEVVGTRFSVQVLAHGSRVAVTHGRVRVSPSSGAAAVVVEAGYTTELTTTAVSAPGPAMVLPPIAPAPVPAVPSSPSSSVRITAADFAAGEGVVEGGVVRAVPVDGGRVTRLMTPVRRPGGYARLDDHLRCTVRLTVDRPTTLALLLVCDQPGGAARWAGNLQAERAIPAGTHELVFARGDLRVTAGMSPAVGSRVVAAAVMCWSAPTDLRLEWLAFDG